MLFKAWVHLKNDEGELDVSAIFPCESIFEAIKYGKQYALQLKGTLKTIDNISTYEIKNSKK